MNPPPHPCCCAAPSKYAQRVFLLVSGGACGLRARGCGGSGISLNADIIQVAVCGQHTGLLSNMQ